MDNAAEYILIWKRGDCMTAAFISVFLINIVISLLGIYLSHHVPHSNHIVKPHPANLVVGVIYVLCVTGAVVAFLIKDRDPKALFAMPLNLLGVSICVYYYNCRTWLTDSSIIQRNFWGRKREMPYTDIIKIEEEGLEITIHFKSTQKRLVYSKSTVGTDHMLETIRSHVCAEQLNDDLPVPPVRLFENSVYNASGFYAIWAILYVLGIVYVVLGVWIRLLMPIGLVFMVLLTAYIFLSVYSAKRAHVSEKWAKVAKHCFKNGYLKP